MSCRFRPCGLILRFGIGLGVGVVDLLEGGSDTRSYVEAVDAGIDGKSTCGRFK